MQQRFCDKQNAIALTKDSVHYPRYKHVDTYIYGTITKEAQQNEEINVMYIRIDNMVADILTKALPKMKRKNWAVALNLKVLSTFD